MNNEDNLIEEENRGEDVNVSPNKDSKGKKTIFAVSLAVIIVLIVVAVFYYKNTKISEAPTIEDKIVATVDGSSINQSELDIRLGQIISQMEAQGRVVLKDSEEEKQLKSRVLENLINDEILLQNAKKAGLKITPEEIDKEIKDIISRVGSEEKFKAQLKSENIKEEEFRDIVAKQFLIQKYILANVDINSISVTDEEVSKFYEQISAAQKGVPPLEEIRSQVENDILANKQRQMVSDFIDSLRKSAKINISL